MPCAEGLAVATAVTEELLAAGVGQKVANVGVGGFIVLRELCAVFSCVEEVDVLDEAGAVGGHVADLLLFGGAALECLAQRWHKSLDVPCASRAGAESGETHSCVRVDDSVPVLVAGGTARAWADCGKWLSDLIKQGEIIQTLFDGL